MVMYTVYPILEDSKLSIHIFGEAGSMWLMIMMMLASSRYIYMSSRLDACSDIEHFDSRIMQS